MGLDEVVFNKENMLSLAEVEKKTGIPYERLKRKKYSKKSGKSSVKKISFVSIEGKIYIPESEIPKLELESRVLNSGEYYSITEAARIIGGIFHDSNPKGTSNQLSQWISNGCMRGIAATPETCLESYLKKEWVHEFAKTKKYRLIDTCKILGVSEDVLRNMINLPEDYENRLKTGYLPTGTPYITEEEIERQKELIKDKTIKVGDYINAGQNIAGRVAEIISCKAYGDDYDIIVDRRGNVKKVPINHCRDCKRKDRIRYVIEKDTSISSYNGYCRKIVSKI